MQNTPMNIATVILLERIAALRKCSDNDVDFAQVVALACATIADREFNAGKSPGAAIREYFQLK